jgi:hypothetical protein
MFLTENMNYKLMYDNIFLKYNRMLKNKVLYIKVDNLIHKKL